MGSPQKREARRGYVAYFLSVGSRKEINPSASIMNCSVWLLIAKVSNAAVVTSAMAPISPVVSPLTAIFESIVFSSSPAGQRLNDTARLFGAAPVLCDAVQPETAYHTPYIKSIGMAVPFTTIPPVAGISTVMRLGRPIASLWAFGKSREAVKCSGSHKVSLDLSFPLNTPSKIAHLNDDFVFKSQCLVKSIVKGPPQLRQLIRRLIIQFCIAPKDIHSLSSTFATKTSQITRANGAQRNLHPSYFARLGALPIFFVLHYRFAKFAKLFVLLSFL
jgi:hypothetical protein